MRGAPQVGFSATIRKIKARTSLLTRFRPPTWRILVTHVQYKRNPARCQFTTVLGVTKTRGCLHADQHILNATQNSLCRAVHRRRGRWTALHKLFWVALRMCWSAWRQPLVLVTPRTVVNWHRAGFRLYWTWVTRIRQVGGRKRVSKEVRALIFRMVAENPTWGAPRIHSELLKLGFDFSERSVSRWICRTPRNPDPMKRWLTFLSNHREAIAAMDFFTVPTLTFWC